MRKSMVSLVFMMVTGCLTDGAGDLKRMVQTNEPPLAFPHEWEELSDDEVKRKLNKMIVWGRLREVKELAKSPVENKWGGSQADIVALAAKCVAERVRKDQAIEFCRELEFDGPAWKSALWQLHRRCERREIVVYLREIAATHGSMGKYYAYQHCAFFRWDDLVEMARDDLARVQDVEFCDIVIPNVHPAPISEYAQGYLIELGLLKGKNIWSWYGSRQD